MNAFIVDLKNKPGEFAKVADALANKGINISGFAGVTAGDTGAVVLVAEDESGTREALNQGQWTYRSVELVTGSFADKPGTLAAAAHALADAGINVEAALPIGMGGGMVQVAFATDNPSKARGLLEAQPVGASR
jgi:hypothetical protein